MSGADDRTGHRRRLTSIALLIACAVGLALVWRFAERPLELPLSSPAPGSVALPPSGAEVLIAAGDISECDSNADEATARLVESLSGTVAALGDLAYDSGSPSEFDRCYSPTWGRFRDRSRPVPGNHEYVTPGAAGYFEYFGEVAGSRGASWYAYDMGAWRIYALDSNCSQAGGCGEGSPQLEWLRGDLAQAPRDCVLAYWHHPRFSSGRHGSSTAVQPFWQLLSDSGADVVLVAHDHLYERFTPLDAAGEPDPERGIRSFVVGTGGKDLYTFRDIIPRSEVRDHDTYGVLVMTLRDSSYDWRFVPIEGETFTDQGSGECH